MLMQKVINQQVFLYLIVAIYDVKTLENGLKNDLKKIIEDFSSTIDSK